MVARVLEQWTPGTVMLTVMLGAMLFFLQELAGEQKKDLEFRSAGGRFTQTDAAALMHRIIETTREDHDSINTDISEVKMELRRVQCQVDRLEGHDCILDGLNYPTTNPHDHKGRLTQN